MIQETADQTRKRALKVYKTLEETIPKVGSFLLHETPFQMLVATVLSAQCTDARVNMVTPPLFAELPTVESFAEVDPERLKQLIRSINFFNTKAENLVKLAHKLMAEYDGDVPQKLDDLIQLPGVGRKTANVVLGQAFGIPGITVDTHVGRLAIRLGFCPPKKDAVLIETFLMGIWPSDIWTSFSNLLILHGRTICDARRPKCEICCLRELCPRIGVI